MVPNIEIIVGTYEEFLLGYKIDIKDEKPVITQSFADKSHAGAIKCLAVQANWVATGSTDDRIFVYDMRTRKQTEIILAHEGTINALTFTPDNTYLFSGGDDGRMIATHVGNWVTNAAWKKAHDGKSVTHISCHPSGKLALTLGSDLILRTWNLVKGRVAYKSNLKSRNSLGRVADCLNWCPTGNYFSLSGQKIVEIWSIQNADVVRSQKTPSKPICVCWINDETCIAGLEDGKIIWFNLNEDEKEILFEAHDTRVKTMVVHDKTLVTASSSGEIKVWRIDECKKLLTEITATNIGCRPTCVGILDLQQFGDNYNIDNGAIEKKTFVKKVENKAAPQRGVVTIEYENDDDEDKDGFEQKSSDEASSSEEVAQEEEEGLSDSSVQSSEEEQPLKSKKRKVEQKPLKKAQVSKQAKNEKNNKAAGERTPKKPRKGGYKQKNK